VLKGLPVSDDRIIPLSVNAVRLAWRRLKRKTGVEGLRMHDLRREAASRAFEKGLGIESVMVLTGHKTPSILLRHYTALKASEVATRLG
jgi:integrase